MKRKGRLREIKMRKIERRDEAVREGRESRC